MINVKEGQTVTIEMLPFNGYRRLTHKRGLTHLVRITIREEDKSVLVTPPPVQGCVRPGKIVSIYEQEIANEDETNGGLARALRRYGEWMRPYVARKPAKRRSGVEQTPRGKIHETGFQEVGGGYCSGRDYREA